MLKLLFLLILMPTLFSASIFAQTAPPLETGVSRELARWRSRNYSDVRYKLNITLEKGAPLMKGDIEISVKLTDEAAKNDLVLDWRTTQFQNDKDKPFAEVEKVNAQIVKETVPNGVFDYQINKEHLVVSKKYLKTGENTLLIKFASPIKTSGAGVTRYVDKEDGAEYIYSLFVPSDASTAFPVFDQPDLKARFTLDLTVPAKWNVVSNTRFHTYYSYGKDIKGKDVSDKPQRFVFHETLPISTYLFAFAAGDFAEISIDGGSSKSGGGSAMRTDDGLGRQSFWGNMNQGQYIYVRKSQAEKFKQHSAEVFRLNREGVKFLETYFDYKFPFPKYDLVLIPEFPFGGMEHSGATFLRESSVIFPTEPTKNDLVSRANVIFHEAAHQWFGDLVTMKWFDDLWLKEGFAEFMAYKTLEKVMPEYNAWKIFYERNKQAAYLTDSTRGTTPIYQEIPNLSAAKSAYGNIVYRKAPSFLKQAEFYLGEKEFQTAARAFLKKHEFANAEWTDLVKEFETASKQNLKTWAEDWVKQPGLSIVRVNRKEEESGTNYGYCITEYDNFRESRSWDLKFKIVESFDNGNYDVNDVNLYRNLPKPKPVPSDKFLGTTGICVERSHENRRTNFIFPNYQDYGYGIFLLDEKSRAYILKNIQNEKDDFLRAMMWGALWDAVREGELDPKDYVALVVKNINVETDESTIQTILSRVSTAMNYYIASAEQKSVPSALAGGSNTVGETAESKSKPPAHADGTDLSRRLEDLLIDKIQNAPTLGLRITFYRAFLNIAATEKARVVLRAVLSEDLGVGGGNTKMRPGVTSDKQGNRIYAANPAIPLKAKDRFDIVTRLLILGDESAPTLLAELEKYETSDEAKRYAYAAKAAIATGENKARFWNDFTNDKQISESYIESAFAVFNAPKHADLTLPYLEKALSELPNLKRNRKIFFVNGWLAASIGGQKSEAALGIVNKFLADNPNLDRDLRLKILENADNLERAVKIRKKFES